MTLCLPKGYRPGYSAVLSWKIGRGIFALGEEAIQVSLFQGLGRRFFLCVCVLGGGGYIFYNFSDTNSWRASCQMDTAGFHLCDGGSERVGKGGVGLRDGQRHLRISESKVQRGYMTCSRSYTKGASIRNQISCPLHSSFHYCGPPPHFTKSLVLPPKEPNYLIFKRCYEFSSIIWIGAKIL